ncbi:lysosomal Pro-X carboxypeptidase-like isoform X2 [Apostichopus japonicus]|uniref:lysosomal Pro-X carboxypeptidase-like isoform X2 n=1 Tax=Stichopus japonicus TaxID=307972 RepID=UPI003AB16A21
MNTFLFPGLKLGFLLVVVSSQELTRFIPSWAPLSLTRAQNRMNLELNGAAQCHATEKVVDMKLDHFDFTNDETFKLRYFISNKYSSVSNPPIFFYTGNEGDIVLFCNNSDLMHLKYLSSEQALADYAYLIGAIKEEPSLAHSPVIAFGGSYGGMLAAWMRMKYPNVIAGSIACSAPIWNFPKEMECNAPYQIVTKDFEMSSKNCSSVIRASWGALDTMGRTEKGRQDITTGLRLCKPLHSEADVETVKSWLSETWFNLAMVDYPYPANFLEPLPANPIKSICAAFTSPNKTDSELLTQLVGALTIYYNFTGQALCFNTSQTQSGHVDEYGWYYQFCTEMVMPSCSDGVTDMFEPRPWDYDAYVKNCQNLFGVTPRADWVETFYWGRDITTASNIFFSNGALDPWSSGGVLTNLSKTLQAFVIPEGAHHLDLRSKTEMDPPGLIQARLMEYAAVKRWIIEYT